MYNFEISQIFFSKLFPTAQLSHLPLQCTSHVVPGNLSITGVSYYQILTVAVVTALSAVTLTVKSRRMPHDCEHHSTKPHQAQQITCPNKDSLR